SAPVIVESPGNGAGPCCRPHVPRLSDVYWTMNTMIPFDHAVEQHGATVLRVCRAVLGSGPDADDAWQETFLSALKAWPDLDPNTNVEAWLVRVAKRKAIDSTRARQRRPIPADQLPHVKAAPEDHAERELDVWQ